MATRMTTLLYGSDRPHESAAINEPNPNTPHDTLPERGGFARESSSWRPSSGPPLRRRARGAPALPAMTRGLAAVAAIWVGMAIFLFALVYPMSDAAQIVVGILGAWILAAGSAYVIADAPNTPSTGAPRFA